MSWWKDGADDGSIRRRRHSQGMANLFAQVRRDILWLQAFGYVGPWQAAWWRILGRRFVGRMETVDVD